jgi:hypothetical protein
MRMMRMTLGLFEAALAATAGAASPGSWALTDACRLLTAADIAAVQGSPSLETKPTSRTAGGYSIEDCFYRLEPFASSVSLEVTRPAAGKDGSDPAERWERMFRAEAGETDRDADERGERKGDGKDPAHAENGDVRGIEKEKSPPVPVPGVGDEAFWIGNRASGVLYALRGHAYVRVSVGGAGSEEEKRDKATQLAKRALARL